MLARDLDALSCGKPYLVALRAMRKGQEKEMKGLGVMLPVRGSRKRWL